MKMEYKKTKRSEVYKRHENGAKKKIIDKNQYV